MHKSDSLVETIEAWEIIHNSDYLIRRILKLIKNGLGTFWSLSGGLAHRFNFVRVFHVFQFGKSAVHRPDLSPEGFCHN